MSKNYMNDSQASEIMKFISDTMKLPIMGAGGGFAPIGTINSYMGITAPIGWLVCDGTVYNISDYPDLATHIASHFGSTNFFGGDGTTTFAVPDLRGEFLRGSGTNSHTNQGSGANVGEHQDGTEIPQIVGGSGKIYISDTNSQNGIKKPDSMISNVGYVGGASGTSGSASYAFNTSRPTNTSVLFIIKATVSDAEINAFNVYTPREHQVAWWEEEIDGVWKRKPVYEKVVDFGTCPNNTTKTVAHNISNVEEWVKVRCTFNDTLGRGFEAIISNGNVANNVIANVAPTVCSIESKMNIATFTAKFTLRYTKTTDEWQTS